MMKQKQETMQPKMTNGSSDLFSIPDDELAELVWENGQIVVQNQSSRPRKSSFPGPFSSRHGGVQEKDTRECANSKFAQFSEGDPLIDDFATPRHSTQNGENGHDDDMVPWISYPIEEVLASEALQNDYCAEFLNEFSAFDLNPLSANKNAIATGRSAGLGLEVRNSTNVEHGHACKAPVGSSEPGRIRSSQLFQQSEQCQSSVPKSTVIDIGGGTGAGGGHVAQERHCGDMVDGRLQRDQGMASCKQQSGTASLMNFSHFARPAALAKVSLQNAGGLRSIEKVSTLSRSNPVALIPFESGGANGVKDVSRESGPRKLDLGSAMKTPQEGGSVEQSSNAICLGDALRKNNKPENCSRLPDTFPSSSFAASVALCRHKVRKDLEAAVASSSMCSGNITGAASNAPKHSQKRKEYEGDESDYHSEDLQEESVGIRKPPSGARTARTKRSRAAEVHNLSEKRRRNRINEKMRALQELIPNCNKVDKASMLEEAIEYLKTLQLQVQIMSMGRIYMPPMMLPPAMQQHIRAPAMAHFPPLGVGMSMGIGLAPGCPMIPIPPMHPPQFPCAPAPGFNGMPGPVSPPLFGLQGQGFPVPMPRPPPFSTLPGVPGTMTAPPARANAAAIAAGDQQQQQN